MTIRLTCNVNDTRALLHSIMSHTIKGERVLFLTEPSMGNPTFQRARVMLSRVRKARKNENKNIRYFNLHHTVHPHTEDGKRFDAVVVWEVINERHQIMESLEDLIGSGEML